MGKLEEILYGERGPHRYPRASSARILSTLTNLAMGIRLLMPDNVLGSTPGYRLLNSHFHGDVPPAIWLIIAGVIMAAGLVTDKLMKLNDLAMWFSFIFWVWFARDITKVNPSQLGTIAYLIIAAMFGYAYFHLLMWRIQQKRRGTES